MNTSKPSADNDEATYLAPSKQSYRAMLLVAAALSTYLTIPLVSGGRLLVPSVSTVALMPLLFLIVYRDLTTADKVFIPKVTFVLLLSIVLSPGHAYLTEKLLSVVQCCLALSVTVMTVRLMLQMRREVLERALQVLWGLLLAGSVLEVTGLTRELSDAFRVWAYEGTYTLYDGDARDINFVGWVRPKVFSIEPSVVTKMFVALINSWLLVRVTGMKAAIVAIATGAMFVIMGSPMLVVSAAITLTILVWNRQTSIRTRVVTVLATLLVSVLFMSFFGETAMSTLDVRLQRIGSIQADGQLEQRSENLRAVVPWLTLVNTWSRWPIFGVGFGGKEVVLEESRLSDTNYRFAMGANAAAEVWTYLGLLGGAWFIWLLLREASQTGVRLPAMMLAVVFLFSMLMGGLDSFRYWGHITLLWGALAVADSNVPGVGNFNRSKGSREQIDERASAPEGGNNRVQSTGSAASSCLLENERRVPRQRPDARQPQEHPINY